MRDRPIVLRCRRLESAGSIPAHQVHLLQQLLSTMQMQLPFPQILLQSRSVLQFELQQPGGTLSRSERSLVREVASAQLSRTPSESAATTGAPGPDGGREIPAVPATARPAQTKAMTKSLRLMASSSVRGIPIILCSEPMSRDDFAGMRTPGPFQGHRSPESPTVSRRRARKIIETGARPPCS